ncbi:MAG: hypothetical protein WBQ32_14330 [Ignavibacteriaceae bacterium]
MLIPTIKYLFVVILFFTITSFAQSERYTKDAENGYMWLAMDDPNLMYNSSKENYLSSILERLRITGEKNPEISSLSCREDIDKLFSEGKSDEFSLEDVVKTIDKFYSTKDNLVIPIIFAYCYTIKKFAGASTKELNEYKEGVLKFCNE